MRNVALTLVHAQTALVPATTAMAWPAGPVLEESRQWQEDEARKIIGDAIKVVEDDADEQPEINSERFVAAPVPTLVDLSKEAQMVVVGCRGQGALRRFLLGSVGTAVVHAARTPVIVARWH
jgi:nucleotide-binding universal stress UspA family protein